MSPIPSPRTGPTRARLALALGIGTASGLVALLAGRRQFDTQIEDRRADLLAAELTGSLAPFSTDELDGLPTPVRTYLETALEPGQAPIETAKIQQSGRFRLGGRESEWRPFEATQHYTTTPPGFVWDATISLAPLVPVRVLDYYVAGDGALEARVFSAIPVALAGPNERMNEGELVRYLAEAVWFPTALLPRNGVSWTAIDDRTAEATVTHRDVTASVKFHFDDDGLISRVSAERYRQDTDSSAPWTGTFEAYERRHGLLIPTAATVAWTDSDGTLPYWRGTIDAVEYSLAEPAEAPMESA